MTKRWEIRVEGKTYTVELEHNPWTNRQRVQLNGVEIYKSPGSLQVGGVTCFLIEGHECAVIVSNKLLGFDYDIAVDNISAITQKKVKYQAQKPVATLVNGVVHREAEDNRK